MIKKRKIPYLNLIPILIIAFILFKLINQVNVFLTGFYFVTSLLTPFFWALGIAYLLNPLMLYFEKQFKLNRTLSILLIYLLVVGIIVLGITIIFPRMVKSIGELLKELPYYIDTTEEWVTHQMENLVLFDKYGIQATVERHLTDLIEQISSYLNLFLTTLISELITATSGFFKFIIGLIMSIYLLKDKESFIYNIKRLIYAILKPEKATALMQFGGEVDQIFSKYLIGKTIDSTIIGIICFVGLNFLKAPYFLLLSIIVGVTNMIPYFGPFIGMIPATIITLFYDPIKALWVLLFIFILQQFDGLYLGPKILGQQVGVGPFWIITGIIIGGGFFGVMGMLLAVPFVAVAKMLLEKYIDKNLKIKNIDM